MKKIILSLLLALCASAAVVSCTEENVTPSEAPSDSGSAPVPTSPGRV